MGKAKAIETKYKGYRFRSRMEARWAVFFDHLGVEWQYEPEGYDLGEAGFYLPDFFLPSIQGGLWVEIKPTKPTKAEDEKLEALVEQTGYMGTFRVGDPGGNVKVAEWRGDNDNAWMYELIELDGCQQITSDGPYIFCVCPLCGKIGFEFDGRGARVCGHPDSGDKSYTGDDWRIKNAVIAARSARFEHGENGVSVRL